ncbi:Mog1p/PsbP-like protein [Multifurca ochricompacta]|uniref:Mog1p/PsbP-like protein n=1 Tax=Multifurca ochricompacta TaxID=376703 RepID=A0AAD4QM10_9AGAM|nr:Mog1p/PsbP-like protein [Multifurca ochricompacta]
MRNLKKKALFGGAITAEFPEDFIDVSRLRQVPDNQEVYLSRDLDVSIVLETLERVPPSDSTEAATFHFDSIAQDNEALSSSIDEILTIPNDRGDKTPSVTILRGRQGVKKFNRSSEDDVRIFLALYRVEEKGVDLVLSLNFPINLHDGVIRGEEQYMFADQVFRSIATSLHIINFDLFA